MMRRTNTECLQIPILMSSRCCPYCCGAVSFELRLVSQVSGLVNLKFATWHKMNWELRFRILMSTENRLSLRKSLARALFSVQLNAIIQTWEPFIRKMDSTMFYMNPTNNYILEEQIEWLDSLSSSDGVGSSSLEQSFFANYQNPDLSSASSPEISSEGNDEGKSTPEEEDSDDDVSSDSNKRKRRQIKNQSETKRRMKFNEQLAALRSLLGVMEEQNSAKKKSKKSKVTREVLLSSAIQEISKLRQELHSVSQLLSKPTSEVDTPFQRLATGLFPTNYRSLALQDPHNRSPFSIQDLERAFQTVFTRELEGFFNITPKRTEQTVLHTIKMLDDMSGQIGKVEYQLSVGILEQLYFSTLKFNAKELRRVLERNWVSYQTLKKTDSNNLLLFADSEVGAWILGDMSLMEYLVGNIEASQRYFDFAKALGKKISHRGTMNMLMGCTAWNLKTATLETAQKIRELTQKEHFWAPLGIITLGHALIAAGKHQEGVQTVEIGVSAMTAGLGNSADLCLAVPLLEAYVQTGAIEKGLRVANHILKRSNELNLDACMGKAEALRQKAVFLMMRQFADFVPESPLERMTEQSITDIVDLAEKLSISETNTQIPIGPQPPLVNSLATIPNAASESVNEDIEMILRSAINLAHSRGLCIVELNCAIDLTKYFVHTGDKQQALETVQTMRDVCSRIKADPSCIEFQRANNVALRVDMMP